MDLALTNQTIQYIAWLLAITELIVGLYVWILNPRHPANRNIGTFLLITAINSYAVGLMVTARTIGQATLPAILLAMTTSAIGPLLLVSTISLLKPEWMKERMRPFIFAVYLLAAIPFILTLVDILNSTQLWYTGINAVTYTGGFLITPEFTMGSLSLIVRAGFILSFLMIFSLLIYIALIDKQASAKDRKLAWLLLIQQFIAGAVLTYLASIILPAVAILITNTIFVITYAYAAFDQMISERNLQRGSLQMRLTMVMLIVALPVMVASTAFITNQAHIILEKNANQTLSNASTHLQSTVTMWLEANVRALTQLARQPTLRTMDPEQQKPLLENLVELYPGLQQVSTVDLSGRNIARSDSGPLLDYSSDKWYQEIISGSPLSLETTVNESSGKPVLVAAVPITNSSAKILGGLMFTTELSSLSQQVNAAPIGDSGLVYVIDAENQVVVHPKSEFTRQIQTLEKYPPVTIVRQGILGPFRFVDETGTIWRAKAELLPENWAVISQVPEPELLGTLLTFQRIAWITLVIEGILLLVLAGLMIRQTIRPIHTLTQISAAVANGDFTQVVKIESDDELGVLARTFNSMTGTVQNLIGQLEHRVAERTQELERRAMQLQVAAEVAREAATIREQNTLLNHTVQLISDRFGFYHAGIFLLDIPGEYAVLVTASSEGGRRMLARGHKLKVGEVGIVGYVAGSGEPRIALDVGQDAVYFNNPDLPLTRSEMALPLKSRNKVIGVLDVQSPIASAFTQEDVDTLLILADQIALAIETARLFQASQEALTELESQYKKQVELSWQQRLKTAEIAYEYDGMGVKPYSNGMISPETPLSAEGYVLTSPIQVRGILIGEIQLHRDSTVIPWSKTDAEIIEAISTQVALALDNARLQEAIRRQVQKEQIASKIAARAQSSLDLETVMRRAVQEIGQALKAEAVQIRLQVGSNGDQNHGNGNRGARL